MARKPSLDPWRVRDEIATTAARMIAEDGLDFASAKRKAARQVIGDVRVAGEWLPDNEHIENEVREYQAIFQSDSQPAILRSLRRIALGWMERLAAFDPYLTGAVWNGTAGAHSDIQLQLFSDAGKDVAIFLLNAHIDYEVSETRHFAGRDDVETLSFMVRGDREIEMAGIHLALYSETDLRGALRADARGRAPRAGLRVVAELVAADAAAEMPDAGTDPMAVVPPVSAPSDR
ncbi:MAG: UDP-N-acetylmuramate--alanine ligase [Janthinobacterium lividum]